MTLIYERIEEQCVFALFYERTKLEDSILKRKTIIFLSLILAAVMVLGACAAKGDLNLPDEHEDTDIPAVASPGPAPNNDATIVIMEVGGKEVTKDVFNQTYSALCQQYGVSEDDPSYKTALQESALELVLAQQVVNIKLKELGYLDLSEEDMKSAKEQAQNELDYLTYQATETITAGLPENYTDEDLAAAITKYEDDLFAQYGITREEHLNFYVEAIALEKAKTELLKDAVPSDEEVNAQYQNSVEADKTEIGDDLTKYESYLSQNRKPYYIPEGIRMVRHVLISIDSETSQEIRGFRQNGDDESANKARKTALEGIQADAEAVLKQLKDGEITFTEAIEQYGKDPGMETYTEGYEVYEGCTLYMQEFTDGAMSLSEIGEITGLVPTDYGYHIIEYTSDKPAGAVSFESMQEEIYNSLLSTLKDEAWQKLLSKWKSEVEYTIFQDKL